MEWLIVQMPIPTYIYRITHIDNLSTYLARGGAFAPKFTPEDGRTYTPIHNCSIQSKRNVMPIPCGPKGVIHDYVPFYFGPRSPMLYQCSIGHEGYCGGQESIIYIVTTVESVRRSGLPFVFSDGHGIAHYTSWYDDLSDLKEVDWDVVYGKFWFDTAEDNDRKRRKQAEFLIHQFAPWSLILGIAVINGKMKRTVEGIMTNSPPEMKKQVLERPAWYYL